MAIYFMDGKTFLNQYVKEDPRKVMKTQFIVVSSTIRKNGKYKNQAINANDKLMPSQYLIVDYDDYNCESYKKSYKEQLDEYARPFLATTIKYAIDYNNSDNSTIWLNFQDIRHY